MSFGSLAGLNASCATSLMVVVWLVLVLEKMPSSNLMSATSTFMLCAAIALALAMTFSPACERRARHGGRARAAGAFAEEHLVGVALDVFDVVRMHAELVGHHLLERGLVALALVDAAGEICTVPPRSKRISAPSRLARRGALDGVRHAEAAQLAVLLRFRLALGEALRVGHLQRQVHALLELAAVVGEGEAGLERHRLRRDVVLPPQFGRVHLQLRRRRDRPCARSRRRPPAGRCRDRAARLGVGEHRGRFTYIAGVR